MKTNLKNTSNMRPENYTQIQDFCNKINMKSIPTKQFVDLKLKLEVKVVKMEKKENHSCLYCTGDIEDIPFKVRSERHPT